MASPGTAIGRTTQILTRNNDPLPTSNGQYDLGPLMECRYERNSRMSWRVVVINKISSVANVLASNSIIPFGVTISAAYLLHAPHAASSQLWAPQVHMRRMNFAPMR